MYNLKLKSRQIRKIIALPFKDMKSDDEWIKEEKMVQDVKMGGVDIVEEFGEVIKLEGGESEAIEVDEDGIRETGQRTGWTAIRVPSSPLCAPMSSVLLCTPSWYFPKELLPPPRDLGDPCFA